jgi:dTDP-4-dehydrorhamnose reductase
VIVVTGVGGQLGTAFRTLLGGRAIYLTRADLDLADPASVLPVLEELRPEVVINCAAYTAVDAAEHDEDVAMRVNAEAVGAMGEATDAMGARLVTFSTDYVFDGTKEGAYLETDAPNPLNVYGRTKLAGERAALAANPTSLVIRTSWVLSGTHPNFAATMLRLVGAGTVRVVDDQRGHPTLVDDLARGTLAALEAGAAGVLHLTNSGVTTWCGLAREVAAMGGLDPDRVEAITTADFPTPARRPPNSVLESIRLQGLAIEPLPDYHESLRKAVERLRSS